jgi:hypothetical protein
VCRFTIGLVAQICLADFEPSCAGACREREVSIFRLFVGVKSTGGLKSNSCWLRRGGEGVDVSTLLISFKLYLMKTGVLVILVENRYRNVGVGNFVGEGVIGLLGYTTSATLRDSTSSSIRCFIHFRRAREFSWIRLQVSGFVIRLKRSF